VLPLVGERGHEGGTKIVAVPPVSKKDTDPAGEYPVTVVVQVAELPTATVDGAQPTVRLL